MMLMMIHLLILERMRSWSLEYGNMRLHLLADLVVLGQDPRL